MCRGEDPEWPTVEIGLLKGALAFREAQNSVGSGDKSMLHAVCVADVEEPGIPALELRPEGLVEYPGSSLKHQVRSAF